MVERYPDPIGEVLAEERDLGVSLAEVVQRDEVGVHLHADADGLGGRAVRKHEVRDLLLCGAVFVATDASL